MCGLDKQGNLRRNGTATSVAATPLRQAVGPSAIVSAWVIAKRRGSAGIFGDPAMLQSCLIAPIERIGIFPLLGIPRGVVSDAWSMK